MTVDNAKNLRLSLLLTECLENNPTYCEVLEIVKKNSEGKIWLVGGAIFRTLIKTLYGWQTVISDWDFIPEKITNPITLTDGWLDGKNKFGNPRVQKGGTVLDIIPLNNIVRLRVRNLEPTIENYLIRVPFTIQRLAYDVNEKILVRSAVGIERLLTKTVAINDQIESAYLTQRKNYKGSQLLVKIAEELGFEAKF